MAAITSNSLAKLSSFRESSFALTQVNYRKLRRTVKQKWNKIIFLISNLQIPFLLSLLTSYEKEILVFWLEFNAIQKQPPRAFPRKSCCENMQQLYRRTPMPKCDFNKVAKHIFRTTFTKNTSGRLLLPIRAQQKLGIEAVICRYFPK